MEWTGAGLANLFNDNNGMMGWEGRREGRWTERVEDFAICIMTYSQPWRMFLAESVDQGVTCQRGVPDRWPSR